MQFRKVYLVGFFAKYCDFNSNVQQMDIKKGKHIVFLQKNVMMHDAQYVFHNTLSCNGELFTQLQPLTSCHSPRPSCT